MFLRGLGLKRDGKLFTTEVFPDHFYFCPKGALKDWERLPAHAAYTGVSNGNMMPS